MNWPAVPSTIEPRSIARTSQGSIQTLGDSQVVEAIQGAATSQGGTVALLPTPVVGMPRFPAAATVRVITTGGGVWERGVAVPRWGITLSIPEGTVSVTLRETTGGTVQVSAFLSQAQTRVARVTVDVATIPAAGVVQLLPPNYATRCLVAVYAGEITLGAGGTALASTQSIEIPATDVNVTAGAAGAQIQVSWEVIA